MTSAPIYNTAYSTLADTDTVATAIGRMLDDRVSDMPVVDGAGKFVGMFRLDRLFEVLLPKAAQMDYGMPDLAFVSETLPHLRERMRAIADKPVAVYVTQADKDAVKPDTSPLEIVLKLYKGANAVPVVDPASGTLVGVATARDVLAALQPDGAP